MQVKLGVISTLNLQVGLREPETFNPLSAPSYGPWEGPYFVAELGRPS